MKWIFYVIVFIYMFYRAVYGAKFKKVDAVTVETVKYEADKNFLLPGVRKTISCAATNKEKIKWIDPKGNVVEHNPANRVFVQENMVSLSKFSTAARTRVPALILVFTSLAVEDTGVWECQAGNVKQNTSLCVIEPSTFNDTPSVTVDIGRSITLSCQVKGDPEPRIMWYRDGEWITDETSSKYQIMVKYNSMDSEGLLTITSLTAEDSGSYSCYAVQESPFVDDCTHTESHNITLQVNHPPIFENGNDTKIVYGTEGESVQLVCSANGYPIPTYKWLKDINDTSSEFSQDKVQLLNDDTEAVLTLPPNSYSWNQRFRCRATNPYGDVYKSFLLIKTEKPVKPSYIQAISTSATEIQFEVTWNSEMTFPVNIISIQYLKVKGLRGGRLRETDWGRSKLKDLNPDNIDIEGLNVTLPDLDENTKYYVRMRAVNSVGESQWSKPIMVATDEKLDVPEEITEETTAEPETAPLSDSTFYGIFFAGGVALIAAGSMFVMRLV